MRRIKYFLIELLAKIKRAESQRQLDRLARNGNLIVGRHTYGLQNLIIDEYKGSEARVIIGNFCSISKEVRIITGGIHQTSWVSTFPFKARWDLPGKFTDGMPYSKGDVVIGNDVWIGTDVTILSGVQIGDGAVIGTGSVVTKSIPPYAIVGGAPAKVIRFRFSQDVINKLMNIKWWEWDDQTILDNLIPFDTSIENFLKR